MATWREIERLRRSPSEFRAIASSLLSAVIADGLTGWESDFLSDVEAKDYVKEYSLRQTEKLLQIRDKLTFVETVKSFSVPILLMRCHEGRSDLSEADEEWIVSAFVRSPSAVRRGEVGRLMRCARQLHLIETADDP